MKAIFDVRETNNAYGDRLPEKYFFGPRYLNLASRCTGDWVIFRQPRAGGGDKTYFAVARVANIVSVDRNTGRYSAELEDYLPFANRVPWRPKAGYWEAAVRSLSDPSKAGRYVEGRSIREIGDDDFAAIIQAGLGPELAQEISVSNSGTHTPILDYDRLRSRSVHGRLVRERAFQQAVIAAYNGRCAITGLRILDAAGRPEAQAAHIWAVADGGPDAVQNGIALSSLAHWLFDRKLVLLTEGYGIVVNRKRIPPSLYLMIKPQIKRIILPADASLHPHSEYIKRKYSNIT
ncbi:HNH endonuclease [Rhizobium anhuiense]